MLLYAWLISPLQIIIYSLHENTLTYDLKNHMTPVRKYKSTSVSWKALCYVGFPNVDVYQISFEFNIKIIHFIILLINAYMDMSSNWHWKHAEIEGNKTEG